MYYQQTMADTFITSPGRADISSRIIEELRELYYSHFDNYCFISLLEQNSFDTSRLRSIQNMLEIQSVYSTEAGTFSDGISALEELIVTSKRYLLPSLKDKLKISGFYSRNTGTRDDVLLRNLFYYTFPHNLVRLEELTAELRANIHR